ncbi:MAG: hypothetical protein ABEH47_04730 [Haloferacaceae archaeon]
MTVSDVTEPTPRERMERAVAAVRREARKAAALGAAAEGTAALLAANLAVSLAGPAASDALARRVPLPAPLPATLGPVRVPEAVDVGVLVAVGVGVAAFAVGYLLRRRRPAVERFEAVNPPVAEALRTARDALESDREGPMADRLYESTFDRLAECSSLGLVGVRRLAAVLVLVALLGVANVQVAVLDVGLGGPAGVDASAGGPTAGADDEYGGLNDPDQVLGEPEDVPQGGDELNATLPTQGGGQGSDNASDSYATGGYESGADVESQQAGFAERERIENAELIREYNLRIREDDEG